MFKLILRSLYVFDENRTYRTYSIVSLRNIDVDKYQERNPGRNMRDGNTHQVYFSSNNTEDVTVHIGPRHNLIALTEGYKREVSIG